MALAAAAVVVVVVGVGLVVGSYLVHTAFAASFRGRLWLPLVCVEVALVALGAWSNRFSRLGGVFAALATAALLLLSGREVWFQVDKRAVLQAEPKQLQKLGAHFIVGYRDEAELKQWVELGAIGGVYVTRRNLSRRSPRSFTQLVSRLQSLRLTQGLPPLVITADQEGGIVAHLSPPLPRLSSLARVLRRCRNRGRRRTRPTAGDVLSQTCRQAFRKHGMRQGEDLRSLGINLDFAPVVDLKHDQEVGFDLYSRISTRAMDKDPKTVASGAAHYCAGLAFSGVGCTAKHFPGLGLSQQDAHFFLGSLDVPRATLEHSEWVPFRHLVRFVALPLAVMVSHIEVPSLEPGTPSSQSTTLLHDILRKQWGYDGLLISDDFSMFPISESSGGIGGATVAALRSGMDYILISYDTDLFYPAMATALAANSSGELGNDVLAASKTRIGLFFDRRRSAQGNADLAAPPIAP